MIPIFLIVSALAPILFGGLGRQNNEDEGVGGATICGFIGFLFNLAWLIAGRLYFSHLKDFFNTNYTFQQYFGCTYI